MTPDIFNWNPRRRTNQGLGRLLPIRRPLNNFGDLLGPLIVRKILSDSNLSEEKGARDKLLSIGSVLHFAQNGDHVWGTGVNGKVEEKEHGFSELDVRAVRGPKTRDFLLNKGIAVPEVYGDPALLLPELFPDLLELSRNKLREYCVVPNFNDFDPRRGGSEYINPRGQMWSVLRTIVTSEYVIGSSLHGVIVADAFGIPSRRIASSHEDSFKYEDYYLGTGRAPLPPAASEREAHEMISFEPLKWDHAPLISAFPYDLFTVSKKEVIVEHG